MLGKSDGKFVGHPTSFNYTISTAIEVDDMNRVKAYPPPCIRKRFHFRTVAKVEQ